VAERTVGAEGGTSAFDGGLVFFALRIGADADAANPPATSGSRRLALLRGHCDREQRKQPDDRSHASAIHGVSG
jgi:hypothetical protein